MMMCKYLFYILAEDLILQLVLNGLL